MTFATGAQHGLQYVAETNFGVTPSTPQMTNLRHTSCSLAISKEALNSSEIRSDRQIVEFRHGNRKISGDLGIELSYGEYDSFLEAAMFSAWANAYALTNLTVSVNATARKFSRSSGSWLDAGVMIGDMITTTGFEDAGNNGTFKVTDVSATEITCADATTLVNVTDDTGVNIGTTSSRLVTGTTPKYFSMERCFADIGQYGVFSGCMVNSLAVSVKPNAIVTGSIGLIGRNAAYSGVTLDSSPTASQVNPAFDSFSGSIFEGGNTVAIVTGLDLSLNNGLEPTFVVGEDATPSITVGRSNVTGSLTAYFEDLSLLNKFLNETVTSLKFTLGDPVSGKAYAVELPRMKYSQGGNPVSGEGPIVISMSFQALYDSVTGSNMIVHRFPGA